MDTKTYADLYRKELLESVIPFWSKHSIDNKYGGFYTCLLQNGQVYDTDKFIWLQARQVWTYAMLYNNVEKNEDWLCIAKDGASFLLAHGRNELGDWYFSLTEKGQPLTVAYNIFSDCFAVMAFAQLYQATDKEEYAIIAKNTFESILNRRDNPKGIYNKQILQTRSLRNFTLPMILSNLCLELEGLLDVEIIESTISHCITEVMDVFYDEETGLVLENTNPDGSTSNTFDGRLLNPGHAIEAMRFIMDIANRDDNPDLCTEACNRMLRMIEYGWDEEYGGIFYFMDRLGHPTQQLEWDQKLWWVHLETLEALAKGIAYNGNGECESWFDRIHEYAWIKYRDLDYGEWFGYLNRQGDILLPLKGGKWKGCFHVPRALYGVYTSLEKASS